MLECFLIPFFYPSVQTHVAPSREAHTGDGGSPHAPSRMRPTDIAQYVTLCSVFLKHRVALRVFVFCGVADGRFVGLKVRGA